VDRVERVGKGSQIFIVSRGKGIQRITGGGHWHDYPAWSPGGRRLAVLNDFDVDVVAARDGRLLHRFAGGPEGVSRASWSPDGDRVAFIAYDKGDEGLRGTLKVGTVGSGKRRTVATNASDRVAWSRNGKTLFYLRGPEAPYRVRAIYSVPRGGGKSRKVVSNATGLAGVSPDGRWLLFTRHGESIEPTQIWIARTDGTDQRRLAARPQPYIGWAPGDRGVFVLTLDPEQSRHPLVVSTDGARHKLGAAIATRVFDWSPNGRRIAWTVEPPLQPTRIRSSRPSGAESRTLARLDGNDIVEASALAWSPDSSRLAVAAHLHSGD
jgi:Tol biopolymer transport system component